MTPTAKEASGIAKLKADYELYAANVLRIKDKKGVISKFALNEAQKYLNSCAEKQLAETGMVRIVVLKGRQQGISTYTQGRFYWKTSMNKGRNAFVLTHEAEATFTLFQITKRYHELNEARVGRFILKPSTDVDSQNRLYFGKLDSGYKVGTAGNKSVGRGSTIHLLHGSEVAFWPNADEHLKGILQAVPLEHGTEVILESTANGVGGVFYDYVMEARAGKGDFRLVFIPWFWQSEYAKSVPAGFERTKEEEGLVKLYGLTDEQLVWRRDKIYELKSLDSFKQEYPCNIDEAFLFSGRSCFDQNWLIEAELNCYNPEKRGDIDSNGFVSRDDGALRIWQMPKAGMRYAIGADVAEGLLNGDYSSVDVCDEKGNQVASWHGHTAPDKLGEIIAKLGKMYNRAFVGVERNNHGLTTLTKLRDLGYQNLYAQEEIESRAEGDTTKRFGWLTTSKSKPFIIDNLAALLRDGESGLASKEHIDEMRTYIIEENGSTNAQEGAKDDRVMSYAITQEMVRRMPRGGMVNVQEIKSTGAGY